jgi:hypothetical protein
VQGLGLGSATQQETPGGEEEVEEEEEEGATQQPSGTHATRKAKSLADAAQRAVRMSLIQRHWPNLVREYEEKQRAAKVGVARCSSIDGGRYALHAKSDFARGSVVGKIHMFGNMTSSRAMHLRVVADFIGLLYPCMHLVDATPRCRPRRQHPRVKEARQLQQLMQPQTLLAKGPHPPT